MQITNTINIAITHKEGSIRNTRNNKASEHENFRYIIDLFLLLLSVKIRDVDTVDKLPKFEF